MTTLFVTLVIAYLLGSISGSLMLGRWRGLDIRAHGSGNAGGTNALRVAGWKFALGVVVIDVGKGMLAAWLGGISTTLFDVPLSAAQMQMACGFLAVIGHCWPIFFGFRGGKGAGTLVGAVLIIAPMFALAMFVLWILVILLWRYVGLATVVAAIAFPVLVLCVEQWSDVPQRDLFLFAAASAFFIIYTHRSNLLRMWRREESRLRIGSRL